MTQETISLRRSLTWAVIAFGVVLAVIIGVRLEQAALTVVVGLACGVGASVPTSLLIVALLQKRNEKREVIRRNLTTQSPPVIVVTPQATPQIRQSSGLPEEYAFLAPSQRQFSVIGEEDITDP
jgi:Na+(H+)/acetate symporter ActP